MGLFGCGSVLMRSAGCIVNDMWDRKIDQKIERTKDRPLASNALTRKQATGFLALNLSGSLAILAQLNTQSIKLGASSLAFVLSYPLMKRITYWPQAFLGLTMNWGALLGWTAVTGQLGLVPLSLYAGGFFWTLVYDTIYAHQDIIDDKRAGVKSTAIRFGDYSKMWMSAFSICSMVCFNAAGILNHQFWPYFFMTNLSILPLMWCIRRVDLKSPSDCLKKFKALQLVGVFVFLGIWLDESISNSISRLFRDIPITI